MNKQLIILPEVDSTNRYLLELAGQTPDLPPLYSVLAEQQTAGRGQRGNSWVSDPGQNLTFSYLLRPAKLKAHKQYAVSEYAAYGLLKTIARYLPEAERTRLSIKWPNDIYYDDLKIAGILIEHSITGSFIDYSVVGIGLNLNQTAFPEDVPNAVSLRQITGESYDPLSVHARLMRRYGFMHESFMLASYVEVHREYMQRLYRRRGLHRYSDSEGSFLAEIDDVLQSGQIVLRREDGRLSTYAFKEVRFE